MTKHFRATHKETGEIIEFGLEDIIRSDSITNPNLVSLLISTKDYGRDWINTQDYNIEYQHEIGRWYKYE